MKMISYILFFLLFQIVLPFLLSFLSLFFFECVIVVSIYLYDKFVLRCVVVGPYLLKRRLATNDDSLREKLILTAFSLLSCHNFLSNS